MEIIPVIVKMILPIIFPCIRRGLMEVIPLIREWGLIDLVGV